MLWTAWTTGGLHHRRLVVLVVMIWPVVLALETRAPQSASERARRKRYVARSGVRSLPVVRDVSNGCGWLAVRCGVAGGVASSRHSGDQDKISGHTASTPRISAIVEAGQHIEAGRAAARSQLHACAGPCARTVRCWCRCSCGGKPWWTLTRCRAEICCESTRRPPSSRRSHSCTSLCRCSMGSVQARGIHSRCPKPNPGWRTRMA